MFTIIHLLVEKMRTFLLLLFLCLPACKASEPIVLTAISADVMHLSELGDAWGAVQNLPETKQDAIRLLRLKFTSQTDLIELSRQKKIHYSVDVHQCEANGKLGARIFALPNIRVNNIPIESITNKGSDRIVNVRDTYNVLVPLAGDELTRIMGGVSVPDRIPFLNLASSGQAICFQIIAAVMWTGVIAKSNITVFSYTPLPNQ